MLSYEIDTESYSLPKVLKKYEHARDDLPAHRHKPSLQRIKDEELITKLHEQIKSSPIKISCEKNYMVRSH
jgi:hypothetical protein